MTKKASFWLILGAILVISGILGFTVLMGSLEWDFSKLGTKEYETAEYEISESFESISIDANTANIVFAPSDDGKCRVLCHEDPDYKHSVSVIDGTLTVNAPDKVGMKFSWFNFDQQKISVYLPEGEYTDILIDNSTGDVDIPSGFSFRSIDITQRTGSVNIRSSVSGNLKVKVTTGNVFIKDLSAGTVNLEATTGQITVSGLSCGGDFSLCVSTGDSKISDTSCKNFYSEGSTGYIHLESFTADGKIDIERDTGDVTFSLMDAAEIYIETDTGAIRGDLLTGKMFTTKTDTGRVRIPEDSQGGICKLTTDTGDIIVTVSD